MHKQDAREALLSDSPVRTTDRAACSPGSATAAREATQTDPVRAAVQAAVAKGFAQIMTERTGRRWTATSPVDA
jgi:hypothetical protein